MKKINVKQGKRYSFETHVNEVLLPREEAEIMEAFYVIIEPGKFTHEHAHPDTEQLYFVISGRGKAVFEFPNGSTQDFEMAQHDLVHVPTNTRHQIFCASEEEPLAYLCIDGFPEGKPKDEPTWDDHYRAVIEVQNKQ